LNASGVKNAHASSLKSYEEFGFEVNSKAFPENNVFVKRWILTAELLFNYLIDARVVMLFVEKSGSD
jgi:uncharacterized membrane protein YcgQ (UPF0703/DUF1980 family)